LPWFAIATLPISGSCNFATSRNREIQVKPKTPAIATARAWQ